MEQPGLTKSDEAVKRELEYFAGACAGMEKIDPTNHVRDNDYIRMKGIRDALAWVLGEREDGLR